LKASERAELQPPAGTLGKMSMLTAANCHQVDKHSDVTGPNSSPELAS